MQFGSSALAAAPMTWLATMATVFGIVLIIALIFGRRIVRKRHFRIRDGRAQFLREHWGQIVSGDMPASAWFSKRLDRQIVEEIALDRMDVAGPDEAERLLPFFMRSGLVDHHKHRARTGRAWERSNSLLTLGRMCAREALPILFDACRGSSSINAIDAARALGRIGTPEAGLALIQSVRGGVVPPEILEPAIGRCYQGAANELLRLTFEADDTARPMLARALAEVVAEGDQGSFADLATDPIPEVRAAAARILGTVRAEGGGAVLARLAADREWFVRLRSVIALRSFADPANIPVLIQGLCDRNRLVRLRSAAALAALEGREKRILDLVVTTGDQYALQALVSEMERAGAVTRMIEAMARQHDATAESALLTVLRGGGIRFLLDSAVRHQDVRVQQELFRLIASEKSGIQNNELYDPAARALALIRSDSRQLMPAGKNGSPARFSEVPA